MQVPLGNAAGAGGGSAFAAACAGGGSAGAAAALPAALWLLQVAGACCWAECKMAVVRRVWVGAADAGRCWDWRVSVGAANAGRCRN